MTPACPRPARVSRAALAVLLLLGVLGVDPTAQAITLVGNRADFSWAPASGPVAGYRVFVTRNGVEGTSPEMAVSNPYATVAGNYNDALAVRVAAFDSAGNQGPLSTASDVVILAAPAPQAPPYVEVEATGDYSIQEALQTAQAGEQVVAHMRGTGTHFLDAGLPEGSTPGQSFGLDQLIVGDPGQPTQVRLIDALALDSSTPLANLPTITLAGLGNGPPCARDGAPGLVIHPGSQLILGGIELEVFDGETCVRVNDLFPGSPDPNVVAFGGGTIALYGDLEGDGVLDPDDNCLLIANANQCDANGNGFGNACDFDTNGDAVVGPDDLSAAISAVRAVSHDATLDFNCDGAVGFDDYSMMLKSFGQPIGPSGLDCAATASCGAPR